MLKSGSKRRRTKAEKAEEEKNGFGDPRILNEKLRKMQKLEEELKEAKVLVQSNAAASEILNGMINNGQARMDENGMVAVVQPDPVQN
jgi:hypothetical protein